MELNKPDPFSISPNPHYLFHTQNIKAILYQARITIQRRQGLVTMLSPVGCGKTTLLRYLWAELDSRGDTATCFVPTPVFSSPFAMVKAVAQSFGVEPQRSLAAQLDVLEGFLAGQYNEGRNVCLFVDEGQLLKDPFLELLRSFLNFESHTAKTIQIVLAGQLEMWERLKTPKNVPFKSRIHTYAMVNPLTDVETAEMIAFRCARAEVENPFPADVIARVYEITKGVPRHVIKICGKARDYMELEGKTSVTVEMVEAASEDAALMEEAAA